MPVIGFDAPFLGLFGNQSKTGIETVNPAVDPCSAG